MKALMLVLVVWRMLKSTTVLWRSVIFYISLSQPVGEGLLRIRLIDNLCRASNGKARSIVF